jgi:dienelactone hydrolase
MRVALRPVWAVLWIAICVSASGLVAHAQQEFPPPQGKGRVVVVVSGKSGPAHYETVTREIAKFGYDAVLLDANAMEGSHGEALKAAIAQAQQMPHALPGKVALVGFSAGGGLSIYYGSQWPELVTGIVAWYPATAFIKDVPGWAGRLKVPVLMFAGEKDKYENCCPIEKAHVLADAAKGGGAAFELITYPGTEHDFVKGGSHYKAESYSDALQRTGNRLKVLLGE